MIDMLSWCMYDLRHFIYYHTGAGIYTTNGTDVLSATSPCVGGDGIGIVIVEMGWGSNG